MKQFKRLLGAVGVAASSLVGANTNTVVGTLPGDATVSKSGAANYRIPIEVPAGVNGLQPNLALVYDSQKRNGLLGVGWKLTGLSSISRCPTTLAQDGFIDGVDFDENDKFCLNGDRLVAVSGDYGAASTEYRTEYASYRKIVSYGSAGNGPAYFKVWYKDGRVAEFGNTADSLVEAQGKSDALSWAISKLTDSQQQAISYSYHEDQDQGEHYLSSIQYDNHQITFGYQAGKQQTKYIAGSQITQQQLLNNIQIKTDNQTATDYYFNYLFDGYFYQLAEVKPCHTNHQCDPAHTFEWNQPKADQHNVALALDSSHLDTTAGKTYQKLTGDFNGDGLADLAFIHVSTQGVYLYTSLSQGNGNLGELTGGQISQRALSGFQPLTGDFNGDGIKDIGLVHASPSQGVNIITALNKGDGTFHSLSDKQTSDNPRFEAHQLISTFVNDVNNDGLADILLTSVTRESIRVYTWLAQAEGTFQWVSDSGQPLNPTEMGATNGYIPVIADYSGDGLPDIAFVYADKKYGLLVYVTQNLGNGTFSQLKGKQQSQENFGESADVFEKLTGDFNGDGLADLALVYSTSDYGLWVYTLLSAGNSEFAPIKGGKLASGNFGASYSVYAKYVTDFNDDGQADIVLIHSSTGWGLYLYRLQGLGDGSFKNLSANTEEGRETPTSYGSYNEGVHFLQDINGDGSQDFILAFSDSAGAKTQTFLFNPLHHRIKKIHNGKGTTLQFSYKPLTDKSVYTKGTDAKYPIQDVVSALYVVSELEINKNNALPVTYRYQYQGFKKHLTGLGSLNFAQISQANTKTGKTRIFQYNQDPSSPHVGQLITDNSGTGESSSTTSESQVPQQLPVGTLPGDATVSKSGAANYRIPIEVPTGVNGLQPNLALVYDSQKRNGLLGVGWKLTGISSINRCPTTLVQAGFIDGVDFDENDKFCLNGDRLVAIKGEYGADGTEYRTEYASYRKIVSYGSAGNGPAYFKVWYKDGKTALFGNTNDAKLTLKNQPDIFYWAINQVEDRYRNSIIFNYQTSAPSGEHYIDSIQYTDTVIQFEYDARPDIISAYRSNATYKVKQRLNGIEIKNSLSTKRYLLAYQPIVNNKQSIVSSIKVCTTQCQPATVFSYSGHRSHHYFTEPTKVLTEFKHTKATKESYQPPLLKDVNGDGLTDILMFENDTLVALNNGQGFDQPIHWSIHYGSNRGWTKEFPRFLDDANGDGLPDVIAFSDGGVDVGINLGNKIEQSPYWWTTDFGTKQKWDNNYLRQTADLNGDGRSDLLVFGDNNVWVTLSNGQYFTKSTSPSWINDFGFKQGWLRGKHPRLMHDVNGDGNADIVALDEYGVYVATSTGQNFNSADYWIREFNLNDGWDNENYLREVVDINNDGLADIVGFNDEGVKVSLSTGVSFEPSQYWIKAFGSKSGEWTADKTIRQVVDINGDELPEIVGFGKDGVMVALNLGSRFAEPVKWSSAFSENEGWKTEEHYRYIQDMNGDGLPDIIGFKDDGVYVSYSKLKQPLLSTVTNGLGHVTKLTYKPLTDKTLYTKSTGSTYPLKDTQPATYVVSKVEKANGIDGFTTTTYEYEGLKFHQKGLGSLGFKKVTSTQVDTGIKTINEYAQDVDARKIGLLIRSQTLSQTGVVLKNITQNWNVATLDDGGITRYQTLLGGSTTIQKSLQDVQLSEVSQQLTYDDFGNVTESQTSTTDEYGTYSQTVNTTYDNDESQWLLGLARRTTDTRVNAAGSLTRTKAISYNSQGKVLTQTIEPDQPDLAVTTTFEYNSFGNQVKIIKSGNGVDTTTDTFVYDANGRFPESSRNSLDHEVSQTNDPFWGTVLTSKDANGLTTTNTYDSFGRLYTVTSPVGTVTTTTRGRCETGSNCPTNAKYWVQVHTTGESPKKVYFDTLARELRIETEGLKTVDAETGERQSALIRVDTEYTALGKIKQKTLPHFAGDTPFWNQFEYDELLRAVKKIAPNGNVTTIGYNGLTQVYTNAKNQTKTVNKNALGQMVSVADTNSQLLNYQYDSFGNLLETRDPLGNATQITYDGLGRKISMNDPDKGAWTYGYDAFGRLIRQQDAKDQVATIAYDVLGRMSQRVDHAEREKEADREISTWQYDQQKNGLMDSVTGPNFSRQVSYDAFSRVQSTTQASFGESFTVQQTYDNLGRPEKTIYPTGLISQKVYNAEGFLTEITDGNAESPTVYWKATSADPYGNVTTAQLGNGYENIRYVDQKTGRVSSVLAHLDSVSVATDYKYTYDTLGNLVQREDIDFNQGKGIVETFTFDELNRLTSSTVTVGGDTPVTQNVSYDELGNIMSKSDVGTYAYGGSCESNGVTAGPHAVTQTTNGPTVTNYCYDQNGNMISGNDRTITYTSFDKPNHITKGSASTAIDYGADRARIRRIDTNARGTTTTYYMGGIYERVEDNNGQIKHKHYIADVAIVTKIDGGETKTNYLHRDHLNSVVAITDQAGEVVERNSFDPWGKKRLESWKPTTDYTTLVSNITTRGFTNHEHLDAVGLIHMNGRVYDPHLGRFLSADPFIQAPTILQSFNRYTYGFNNPLSMTDPTGFTAKPNYSYADRIYDSAIDSVRNYNRPTPLKPSIRYSHREYRERYQSARPSRSWSSWRAPARSNVRTSQPSSPVQTTGSWSQYTASTAPANFGINNNFSYGKNIANAGRLLGRFATIGAGTALSTVASLFSAVIPSPMASGDLYTQEEEAQLTNTQTVTLTKDATRRREVKTLYHYTSDKGLIGILSSQMMLPSLKANNPNDARYGDGQYFSDIVPGTKNNRQLSRAFIRVPFQENKFKNYIAVDVSGLNVIHGRDHVYVVPNKGPLNVSGRIVSYGLNER